MMNYNKISYLGKAKTEDEKESVIGAIKKHRRKIDKTIDHSYNYK